MRLCSSLSILWHCLSLGLEWKLTFSSPVATAVFQICKLFVNIKIPIYIFHRTETSNTKIYMEPQKTQNRQNNPKGKEKSWRHNSLRLQTILQSSSAQRSVDQDRKPPNEPVYLLTVYDRGDKNTQCRKDGLFNKWCWKSRTATWTLTKSEHSLQL